MCCIEKLFIIPEKNESYPERKYDSGMITNIIYEYWARHSTIRVRITLLLLSILIMEQLDYFPRRSQPSFIQLLDREERNKQIVEEKWKGT
jgi:hypothetical protein